MISNLAWGIGFIIIGGWLISLRIKDIKKGIPDTLGGGGKLSISAVGFIICGIAIIISAFLHR